ncbi:Replication protein C N-terminal domain-containing protein, partial [Rhizobium sp. RU20A]|uniref:plasmid replication protein RepC n=1 Tax=Rhizobium sp. RU20A TaxID=1907412 RepID=UPI000953BDD0
MQTGYVTTPFGRRPVTLALVASQKRATELRPGKSADKWKIYRDACDARTLLGVRDRALAVLSALLSFYPDNELREGANLIVFPSNAQLTARANGIAGTTLRENLVHLVEAGLIHRNDSPNGKRYARKDSNGAIETAYGFNLA